MLKPTTSKARLVLVTLWAALCFPGAGAEADAPPTEDVAIYFSECEVLDVVSTSGRIWTLDGRVLPSRMIVRDSRQWRREDFAIEFVLIEPGQVNTSGLTLNVERPFYVAIRTLTWQELGQLQKESGLLRPREEMLDEYLHAFRDEFHASFEHQVREYLADPEMPGLLMGQREALSAVQLLSSRVSMTIRLPTLAEWLLAARGGAKTTFWWGNDWDPEFAATGREPASDESRTRFSRPEDRLPRLHPAGSGRPNPYGLFHAFGNVREVTFPSLEERRRLNAAFGLVSPRANRFVDVDGEQFVRMSIYPYTLLPVGGGVERFPPYNARTSSLLPIIMAQERVQDRFFDEGPLSMTGLRPVIEIPDGLIDSHE
ncbi:MAG: SUMF1/EgtB/PvdO family nonheme iron enzyme [Phycisphaeraceae bacterium]